MGIRIARWVVTVLGLAGGFALAHYSIGPLEDILHITLSVTDRTSILTLVAVLGGLLGYAGSVPLLNSIWRGTSWAENKLEKMPIPDIMSGVVGLSVGLIINFLLASSLARIPWAGNFLPTGSAILLGYLGLSVGIKKREELGALLGLLNPRLLSRLDRARQEPAASAKLLDTSVIIDGRIADVCKTGFLEGPLVVPGFVLEELRHIADASDPLKRNRGRRGLDVLDAIQKLGSPAVQILDRDAGVDEDVDSKLVRLAKQMKAKVLTNDYNLNRVAQLHGVRVLNINELANALKPVVLPGEDMVVQVIRDGKEHGQGVGYLDDGTMIVVEGGRRHIGEHVPVQVTSVYQTGAGRMIFARPKGPGLRAEKAAE
jgi:uncharacterized protein YacL